MSQTTPYSRLHPSSVWVNALPRTLKSIGALWWLFIPVFAQENTGRIGFIELFILLVVFGSGLVSSFVHYSTLRYRMHEGMLELRYGLLNRRSRRLDPARIQNIEIVRNPLHKMSGLVELRVETAGEAREEGLLSALTEKEARSLRASIEAARGEGQEPVDVASSDEEILNVSAIELVAYGISSSIRSYFATTAVLVFVAWSLAFDSEVAWAKDLQQKLGASFFLGLLLLGVLMTFLSSVFKAVLRHWAHFLFRTPDGLRTEEGLFTRRKVEIPHQKVQVLKVREPLLRRWMGYGTVYIETAGLGSVKEGVFSAETAVPMVAKSELRDALTAALPDFSQDPWQDELAKPARNALFRAWFSGTLQNLPIVVLCALFYWPIGLASLLLLPTVWAVAAWEWHRQGWRMDEEHLVVQRGIMLRDTRIMPRAKVQALHLHQGPLMRWYGISRLYVFVADSVVALPVLEDSEAQRLFDRLSEGTFAAKTG